MESGAENIKDSKKDREVWCADHGVAKSQI